MCFEILFNISIRLVPESEKLEVRLGIFDQVRVHDLTRFKF